MTPLHITEYILFTDDLEIIFIRNLIFFHVIILFYMFVVFYQNLIWERSVKKVRREHLAWS